MQETLVLSSVEKLLLKNEQLLPPLEWLREGAGAGKNFGILHLGSHILYGLLGQKMVLMVKVAEFFIKKFTNMLLFLAAKLCEAAKLTVKDLRGFTFSICR